MENFNFFNRLQTRKKGPGSYFPGELLNVSATKELVYPRDTIALFNAGRTHSYRKIFQTVMKHLTLNLALYTLKQAWKRI
jgi:hypothetical protein